ncbi:TRM11 family SAM-dependent methyltransferase [Priestia megaterium]|uniref:TRM11 family SAM-dependent methyltransferase n=1 Tax=Priestia megaterium TaxID=1404 RepID=UPI0012B6E377|nr:RNA methyltransferase [Priestia megaterium]
MNNHTQLPQYIYTYACSEEELSLCQLERRSLFEIETEKPIIKSAVKLDPSRSPFIKERLDIMYESDDLADICKQVEDIDLGDQTFKLIFMKINDLEKDQKISYKGQRAIERDVGWHFVAKADLHNPDHLFGIVPFEGRWYFGKYQKSEAVWLHHLKKPREYSTALSTRLARAVANIAVPKPEGIKAIDPCCGIGTVLVEALSMGIDIVGRDINPLVTDGSRENIAHFGLKGDVKTGPISDVTTHYDVAIIDMPYNLYTHATPEDQLSILKHARRFADKVVVITVDTIDHMIHEAGFSISDRCVARKSVFSRQVVVCE